MLVPTSLSSERILKTFIKVKFLFNFLVDSLIVSASLALVESGNKAPISMFYSYLLCEEVRWSVHPRLSWQ